MRLKVNNNEQCVGCLQCELICSISHEDTFSPWLSRLHIQREELILECKPVICLQCKNAKCASACPVDAIKLDNNGILRVDNSLCSGCYLCVEACPFDAMFFNTVENIALKCDLCGGEPNCVKVCPANVLLVG